MALWMLNWAFLAAVGLVLESMISLLTKEFIPCMALSVSVLYALQSLISLLSPSLPYPVDHHEHHIVFPAYRAYGKVL